VNFQTFNGPAILTRYLGPTDSRGSRVVATHKRDGDRTIRSTVGWDHSLDAEENHRAAAGACLARCEFSQPMAIIARGHDHGAYLWVAVGLWQLETAALALEACRALEVAAAGGATAEALALPVALARMATGTDHPRPLITGAVAQAAGGVSVTDHLAREVCRMPGSCSMAGALAAAQAAGWPLSPAAAATAARLQGPPDPAAVAIALEALGGCPAVIATLKGEGVTL
jgi:hypothetical protein